MCVLLCLLCYFLCIFFVFFLPCLFRFKYSLVFVFCFVATFFISLLFIHVYELRFLFYCFSERVYMVELIPPEMSTTTITTFFNLSSNHPTESVRRRNEGSIASTGPTYAAQINRMRLGRTYNTPFFLRIPIKKKMKLQYVVSPIMSCRHDTCHRRYIINSYRSPLPVYRVYI